MILAHLHYFILLTFINIYPPIRSELEIRICHMFTPFLRARAYSQLPNFFLGYKLFPFPSSVL